MSLRAYLDRYFVDQPTFAQLAGISPERLQELLDHAAIPAATYVCNEQTISSAVFGAIDQAEGITGHFFRPECVRWAQLADSAPNGQEQSIVTQELTHELRTALQTMTNLDAGEIQERIDDYLPSFFDGTFGLCAAEPQTGQGIVRKEWLQERLTALTENGKNAAPVGLSRDELLTLINDYAVAAMPFSPAEYARSSRKRLVEDLYQQLTPP